ncbi:MAG: pvuIIM [Haloplasmataceae bacterium]|nr:pvuIIM [Haloplasmataceae bacterium]
MISEKRNYLVLNTEQAKNIVKDYLIENKFEVTEIAYGLPEIIDRYDIWNVPIIYKENNIGEIAIDAYDKKINTSLSSDISILVGRMKKVDIGEFSKPINIKGLKKTSKKKHDYAISNLNNMIIKGRSEIALGQLPEQSIDLIFTSPPYFNARKEYSEFHTYEDYLELMRKVIKQCQRVLIDGKFFVINTSHVLVPRASRSESSTRIAVPFDIHQIFMEEGFEFVDDIIWQKPEGAGWASGRGRRFSADRNPLQYKAVPVTEYVMVYRKKPCILIDHFIRNHPNPEIIEQSKIESDYEKTNIWYISPARDKRHPAIFPLELAEKVIKYYSFKNDVILDPFGGIGTTAKAAHKLNRRFCTIEVNQEYIDFTLNDFNKNASNFLNNFDFEYIDYSNLTEIQNDNVDLKRIIKELLENGISQNEMLLALQNLKKAKM